MRSVPVKYWLLTTLSAFLQTLPYPLAGPVPVWQTVFCWIALAPFLFVLCGNDRHGKTFNLRQAGMLGYLCGCLWYLGNCYWIYQTMHLYGGLASPIAACIVVLFCLYLGLYHALFAVLFAVLRRSRLGVRAALLLSPFLWVAVELARARFTGFPWDLLGITQVDNSLLTRIAPYTGAYGLSFVIVSVNALWFIRIRVRERRFTRPALTLASVSILLLYLAALRRMQMPTQISTHDTATLIQENLGVGKESNGNYESAAQMLQSFSNLSIYPPADRCYGIPELSSTRCLLFVDSRPEGTRRIVPTDLVAWPESPAGFRSDDPEFRKRLVELARAAGAPLVIGSLGIDADETVARGLREYDSANLVGADGSYTGRYDKIHLVPWGEYVPFKRFFSFADRLTAGVGDMDRGKDRTIFATGGHRIGVFICYESIFGDEVRQFVRNGAEVLVNISDDGWYGDSSAAWQHLNMARMRAIENRRWILRSTNTGVTAAIDPYGRVTASAPRHIRTALHTGFNYEGTKTFYTKQGDLFAYLCMMVTIGALSYSLLGHEKEGSQRMRNEA